MEQSQRPHAGIRHQAQGNCRNDKENRAVADHGLKKAVVDEKVGDQRQNGHDRSGRQRADVEEAPLKPGQRIDLRLQLIGLLPERSDLPAQCRFARCPGGFNAVQLIADVNAFRLVELPKVLNLGFDHAVALTAAGVIVQS